MSDSAKPKPPRDVLAEIRIAFPPEPLTMEAAVQWEEAKREGTPSQRRVNYCRSPEWETLEFALRRYWLKETSGHSILISGHRGAGKTTLVSAAVSHAMMSFGEWTEAENENRKGDPERPRRLLPIIVDAPELLPDYVCKPVKKSGAVDELGKPDAPTPAPGAAPLIFMNSNPDADGAKDTEESEFENDGQDAMKFLSRLVTSFYRAFARFAAEEARFAGSRVDGEIIAHFPLELDNAPLIDVLREYWRRLGALDSGLFFADQANNAVKVPRDQGLYELRAIGTAAQAYQKIIATVSRKRNVDLDSSWKQGKDGEGGPGRGGTVPVDAKQKNGDNVVFRTIAALMPGGIGGAAYFGSILTSSNPTDPEDMIGDVIIVSVLIALVSIVTYLAAGMVSGGSRTRTVKHNSDLTYDTSLVSLKRDIPEIMERTRQAGILPVFIIDEMDKLYDVDKAMAQVGAYMKRLLKDNAFFIFLCDRDYFEQLETMDRGGRKLLSATYFQQRLLIAYRPSDMFRFLFLAIEIPGKMGGYSAEDRLEAAELRTALSLVAMHKGRMHQFDTMRALYWFSGLEGALDRRKFVDKSSFYRQFRRDILLQLAIQSVLTRKRVLERMERNSLFTQQVYDAVYYPSRSWEQKEKFLDLRPSVFWVYMVSRTHSLADENGPENGNGRSSHTIPSPKVVAELLPTIKAYEEIRLIYGNSPEEKDWTETMTFLYGLVNDVVSLVIEPEALLQSDTEDSTGDETAADAALQRLLLDLDLGVHKKSVLHRVVRGLVGSLNEGAKNARNTPA